MTCVVRTGNAAGARPRERLGKPSVMDSDRDGALQKRRDQVVESGRQQLRAV